MKNEKKFKSSYTINDIKEDKIQDLLMKISNRLENINDHYILNLKKHEK